VGLSNKKFASDTGIVHCKLYGMVLLQKNGLFRAGGWGKWRTEEARYYSEFQHRDDTGIITVLRID
jgi:hypothetical protein